MKKIVMSIAAVATMLLVASCGNKNFKADTEDKEKSSEANTEATANAETEEKAAYELFTVEKYGVTVDVLKGLRRTDNPVMDNGACWTLVPEDDDDFPIYAAVQLSVYESYLGDYTDERIKEEFEKYVPEEAQKQLDLEKKEYSYWVDGNIKEYHRAVFKDNKQLDVMVSYTDRWEKKLGGDVRDHILNSAKFN